MSSPYVEYDILPDGNNPNPAMIRAAYTNTGILRFKARNRSTGAEVALEVQIAFLDWRDQIAFFGGHSRVSNSDQHHFPAMVRYNCAEGTGDACCMQ